MNDDEFMRIQTWNLSNEGALRADIIEGKVKKVDQREHTEGDDYNPLTLILFFRLRC